MLVTRTYPDGSPRAPRTPWGPAQHETEHAPGIVFYSTAGHGGFYVAPERRAEMPASDRGAWFEEDCEAARVICAFPSLFTARQLECARTTYATWLEGGKKRRFNAGDDHITP